MFFKQAAYTLSDVHIHVGYTGCLPVFLALTGRADPAVARCPRSYSRSACGVLERRRSRARRTGICPDLMPIYGLIERVLYVVEFQPTYPFRRAGSA